MLRSLLNLEHQALALVGYVKARLAERSTWAAIGVGVTGAAALSSPWSFVAAVVGVIGALVPTSGGDHA